VSTRGQRLLELGDAIFERQPRRRPRQHGQEHVGIDRLGQKVVGALAHQIERQLHLARARHHHHFRGRTSAQQRVHQLGAGGGPP
jgi:hypothetical protein